MQKNRLSILRKHGELWSDKDYSDYLSAKYKKDKKSPFGVKENHLFEGTDLRDSPLSITFFKERYTVDQRVFKVLEESIESFLHPLAGFNGSGVEEKITKRLKLYPPIKELKVKMLGKEIIELTEDYERFVREKLHLLSTPINEQELISTWYFYLTDQDFEKLIELLKFDIFEGERIESYGYPFIRETPKNTNLLDDFFYKCDKLCLLQEATSMLESILYLKELINEIENQNEELVQNTIADERDNLSQNQETNIFCKRMPIKYAKDHFEVFCTTTSKNGKPFLTEDQFNDFINKAFLGNEVKKINLNYSIREKWFVVKRFREFYEEVFKPGRNFENNICRSKYIKLLTENFIGWEYKQVEANFAKKVNREW